MASLKKTQTTNQVLFETIRNLIKMSNESGQSVYKAVANKLSAPASQRAKINLSKINKFASDGEKIIVGGKVLGDGLIEKKITIIAFSFSQNAIDKIKASGSKHMTINEYLSNKPDGKLKILA